MKELKIPIGDIELFGNLDIPENPRGLVIFAHGSGSSRFSSRNRFVAEVLKRRRFTTLLFDLLTASEGEVDFASGEYRFNIDLLAERLVLVTDWATARPFANGLKLGYFGASTGAAAALIAAAKRPEKISAVVSRGGRPDLAKGYLSEVRAPTLLIVGGEDFVVVELNYHSLGKLKAKKELKIIPGATHLFEEPGALSQVAELAGEWFEEYLK